MSEGGSWLGKAVRNLDGREGRVVDECEGYKTRLLVIGLAGQVKAYVRLCADGPDQLETGWFWHCVDFDGGPRWLALGDHWPSAQPSW